MILVCTDYQLKVRNELLLLTAHLNVVKLIVRQHLPTDVEHYSRGVLSLLYGFVI